MEPVGVPRASHTQVHCVSVAPVCWPLLKFVPRRLGTMYNIS